MIVEWKEVRKLEKVFNYFITEWKYHPICVTSWTTALDLALKAIDIKETDEVIVPDFTFIATANAVKFQNANVVFADVDQKTYNITLEEIKKVVTPKTKAIIVVHLFGNPIEEIKEIAEYCKENNIKLIEDCAQCHGATIHNQKAWSFWDISCFSFMLQKICEQQNDESLCLKMKIIIKRRNLFTTTDNLKNTTIQLYDITLGWRIYKQQSEMYNYQN